jgi:hypothetical protein
MTTHRIDSATFRALLPLIEQEDCHPFPHYSQIGVNDGGLHTCNGRVAVQLGQHGSYDTETIDPRPHAAQALLFDQVQVEATPADKKTEEFFGMEGMLHTQILKTLGNVKRTITVNAHYLKYIAELAIAVAADNETKPYLNIGLADKPDGDLEAPVTFQLEESHGGWSLMNVVLMPIALRRQTDVDHEDSQLHPQELTELEKALTIAST